MTESESISAKKAALTYYGDTVFAGHVAHIQIKDSMDFASAVIPYRIKDVLAVFHVTMSDQAKRTIVLAKKGGEWEVINEGV